ncbi:MAG: 23S rRNA (adenine(2503)-C(2))-methyltransferase RlmN [Phycisphaeraceae bacterium]|nr:23S rRNA (adenine(2503)-C(2))-methyltransferase RlmN [Phycisphaeraceae bacterium]
MASRPCFFDLTRDELADLLAGWKMPRYRTDQLLQWVYRHGQADPRQMSNLSEPDRQLLARELTFTRARIVRHQSASDGTQKLLLDWSESALPVAESNNQTECVMIPADDRRTACISSQVGCPVGCRFCASGLGGLDGNLTSGQIVEQVWQLNQLLAPERITHVVFMGMGEPMANFDAVTKAVRTLMAEWATHISGRRITISTVGLPAQMRRLAELQLPITLAISLHAPNDALRRQLIPWAQHVSIAQLVEAGRYYFQRTGREITLEYILLHQVNDQPQHAAELARVARQLRSNVNLIRYNEVAGLAYNRPDDQDVRQFQQILRQAGINCHIRASRGRDISAACGQLRHEHRAATN